MRAQSRLIEENSPEISFVVRQLWTRMIHNIEMNRNPWIGANVSEPTSKLHSFERFKSKLNANKASDNGFGTFFELWISKNFKDQIYKM